MRRRVHIFILLFFLPLFIQTALAEEEHGGSTAEFLGKAVNFIILFGGLAYILYKPIRNFLEGRVAKIESSFRELEGSRREVEQDLSEVRARLNRLEEEIEEIHKEGERQGQEERKRIIESAGLEAERIRRFTKEEIEMFTRAALRELREHAAELATDLALERIRERLSPELASQLIDKSIKMLEELDENTGFSQEVHSRVS